SFSDILSRFLPALFFNKVLQAAPFVGRAQELVELTTALSSAKAGQGSSWLVGGESGVGKSRLLDELRTQAQVEGFQVLRGQAVEGGGLPYQLWREPLRRLALTVEMSDLEAGILKPVVPDMAALLERDIPDAPELTGEAGQQRLALTIATVFERQPQPIALLLEDLQWSTESLEPLRQMNRFVGGLPLLLVASYRSDERPNLPDELRGTKVLTLERLHEDEIAALSEAMLGVGGSEPYLVERLQQETEGNTFFMVEIVRALAEAAGRLGDISQMTLPRSIMAGGIQKLVRRRLERMPSHLRGLLKLAAVAGREIDLAVLGALDQTERLQEWLQAGSDAAVLEIQDQRWRFAHDKLRQVVLVDLAEDETRLLNRQVAEAIEAAYPNNVTYAQVLFDHWYKAEYIEKSSHYAHLAAEQLIGRSSYREALALLEKAFAMLPPEGMTTARMGLLKLMGEALNPLGELSRAMNCFTQSLALAQREQDTRGLVGALIGIYDIKHTQGDIAGARQDIEEAFRLAQGLNDDAITAKTLLALGTFYRESDYARSQDYFLEAMKLYEKLGGTEGQAGCHFNLAVIQGYFGDMQESLKHLDAALLLFKASGNRRGIFSCLNTTGNAIGGHDRVKAERLYREALQIARETGERRNIAIACNNLANMLMDLGRYRETVALQMESVSIAEELNARITLGGTLINLGLTHHELGDFEAARSYVERGLEISRSVEGDGLRYVIFGLVTLSSILRKQGQLVSARPYPVEALALAESLGEIWFIALTHLELGLVAIESRDYHDARQHLDEALKLCEQQDLLVEKAMSLAPHGLLSLLEGDLEQARAYFSDSIELATNLNNYINIAIAQAHLAFVEFQLGNRAEAQLLVQEGLATASRIASKHVLAHLLAVQAWLLEADQPERSALLCGLIEAHPSAEHFMKQWCLRPLMSRLRDQFGEETFAAIMKRGQALAIDDAVREEMTQVM
ncbi:MAG: tetratricopeptide repeat protein, partial [Anaerolineae bacterium]|nr:tetratricopeptide repeat protein [Anaerolineae bacterium]